MPRFLVTLDYEVDAETPEHACETAFNSGTLLGSHAVEWKRGRRAVPAQGVL